MERPRRSHGVEMIGPRINGASSVRPNSLEGGRYHLSRSQKLGAFRVSDARGRRCLGTASSPKWLYESFGAFALKTVARLATEASRVLRAFKVQRFSIVVRIDVVSCST